MPGCEGDGQIIVDIPGSVDNFTFQWSNGETTKDISNLPSGNYQLEIVDDNGCVSFHNIDLHNKY